jgi:hypothetical protein
LKESFFCKRRSSVESAANPDSEYNRGTGPSFRVQHGLNNEPFNPVLVSGQQHRNPRYILGPRTLGENRYRETVTGSDMDCRHSRTKLIAVADDHAIAEQFRGVSSQISLYAQAADLLLPYDPARRQAAIKAGEVRRVVRGGSWHSPPNELRGAFRKGLFPESQLATVGFRCGLPARNAER